MEDIETLRSRAPRWSMAGDKQLLDTLQSLHQKIMSKCDSANDSLCEMATALDDAAVHLHNVNNKLMALSNSQFIESRVYDDDVTTTVQDAHNEEQPKPTPSSDPRQALVSSLQVLESFHETVTILPDSDSSSSDDEQISRVVLRPKDTYRSRPLPYLIGSYKWKTKWHSGVINEDSDTESEQSRGREQYSDSEPEHSIRDSQISTPSSMCSSDPRSATGAAHPHPGHPQPAPADVANELARRLGAVQPPPVPPPDVEARIEPGTARKVYRVDKPATTTVFPDEPPPLLEADGYSEPDDNSYTTTRVDNEDSEPDDIFAELKQKPKGSKPYDDTRKVQSFADDLFGDFPGGFQQQKPPLNTDSTPISTLYPEQNEPDLLDNKPTKDTGMKKPIGGISLFGTNMNNASIGAAILKRNQREASDESDDTCQSNAKYSEDSARRKTHVKNYDKAIEDDRHKSKATNVENRNIDTDRERSKENDLINDLFAKTKEFKKTKSLVSNAEVPADIFGKNFKSVQNSETGNVKDTKNKLDLFNDNIFDDIDDIFTSNVAKVSLKEPSKEQTTKSLFDDDNDLFNENKETTDAKESQTKNKKEKKSIFDSDDELFCEKVTTDEKIFKTDDLKAFDKTKLTEDKLIGPEEIISQTRSKTAEITSKPLATNETSKTKAKRLFDSDDDDDIFTKIKTSYEKKTSEKSKNRNTADFAKSVKTYDTTDIFGDKDDNENIFFTKTDETPKIIDDKLKLVKDKSLFNSPNLFDDDNDELFAGSSKQTKSDKLHSKVLEKDETFQETNVLNKEVDRSDQNTHISAQMEQTTKETLNAESDKSNDDDWDTEDKNNERNSANLSFPNIADDKYEFTTKEQNIEPKIDSKITKEKDPPEVTNNKKLYERKSVKNYKHGVEHNFMKTDESEALNDKIVDNIEESDTEQNTFSDIVIKSYISNDIIEQINPVDPKSSNEKLTEQKITNVFNDLPPEFEKPKEPKKSKNINALFDDDSDDETFFKKNDALIDENDKIDFIPSAERIFGLFDEPPAINVDFVQKHTKNTKIEEERNTVCDITQTKNKHVESDDIFKPNTEKKSTVQLKNTHEQSEDDPDGKETPNESLETKNIGKLRTMNLNINVNTLLPGASPKKQQKCIEQTDGQITKSNEELANKKDENFDKIDTKIIKSVSFDECTDLSILDNKSSKERAKIQVKRRPSTRRARKEAVKVSGIDFGEDSTDNSSANAGADTQYDENNTREVTETTREIKETSIEHEIVTSDAQDIINAKNDVLETRNTEKPENIAENQTIKKESTDVKSKLVYILHDEDIFNTKSKESKITDLETDCIKKENIQPENVKKSKILDIFDDDDDLFKLNFPKTKPKTSGIETLGKVYAESETSNHFSKSTEKHNDEDIFKSMTKQMSEQENKEPTETEVLTITTNKEKSSLFDDLSDSEDELFGKTINKSAKNKPTASTSNQNTLKNIPKMKSVNLFSSDSEEDIFSSNKKKKEEMRSKTKEVEETKKMEVKGSLFSYIEDDDLFGTTKKTERKTVDPNKSSSNAPSKQTSVETVYNDPLSMLGDDE